MRKLPRIALYLALVVVGAPLALYLFLVLANVGDEDLVPDVIALLDASPALPAPEENGYFAWIGVRGPAAQDPHAWGRRWNEERLALADAGPDAQRPVAAEVVKAADAMDIPCYRVDRCLETVAADPAKARSALNRDAALLSRIDRVMAYPAYRDLAHLADFATPLPPIPYTWRGLSATRFGLAVHEGRHDAAIEGLGKDMALLRRQLAGTSGLVEKIFLLNNVRSRMELLSQYMRLQPDAAHARIGQIAALLAPLPAEDVNLNPAIAMEERQSLSGFRRAMRDAKSRAAVFAFDYPPGLLRPNQSLNECHQGFARWRAIDSLQGEAYRRGLADAGAAMRAEAEAAEGWGALRLRNPVGHILNSIAVPDLRVFFRRRDDLLAMQQLAVFQLEMLRRDIKDPPSIGREVAAHATLIHAFNGKTPTWNPETRQLAYPAPTNDAGNPISNEPAISIFL